MYNSLFWSISPKDAVTQGGFLVDIVDDDIPYIHHQEKHTQAVATTRSVHLVVVVLLLVRILASFLRAPDT